MSVTLNSETERRIQHEIDRGRYSEPSEVINDALDLLLAEDDWIVEQREAIHRHILEGLEQVDRGEAIPLDRALQILEQRQQPRER